MIYLSTLFISLAVQTIAFFIAYKLKTDKLTDLVYGLTFIILCFFLGLMQAPLNFIQIALLLAVAVWGARLANYLFLRIFQMKKDDRFDQIRTNPLKFASFWLLQGFSVWLIMLPITYTAQINQPFGHWLNFAGILIFSTGLAIETIADNQKFVFKLNHPKKFIQSGLWKFSRHPNYLGELLIWWGLFITTIPYQQGLSWLTIIGPMQITILLLFVSGIPTLEKKHDQKYGNDPQYQRYKEKTPILLPLIKSS